MPDFLLALNIILLVVMGVQAIVTVVLARRYHRREDWLAHDFEPTTPTVTVIVPAFNEQATIANALEGLSRQTYPHLNVLVVDDGSTDGTSEAAQAVADSLGGHVPITVTRKGNGGKASALNYGLLMTNADIIVCVDADSILTPDAIERIVEPFADPTVGAVGGFVKVANTKTVLGRHQAMEYISGLAIQRAAFAELDAIQVLSGALSAFRRDSLRKILYSRDTLVEDFDVTIAMHAHGDRVVMHPDAIAYTEGPLSLGDLQKQRYRWTFGRFQVLSKYRDSLFTDDLGELSRVVLPYAMIFPWVDVVVSVLFSITLLTALLTGGLAAFAVTFLVMSLISFSMNMYALRLTGERRRLAFWGLLMPLTYAHVLSLTTARAGLGYVRKRRVEWESLERGGHNVLEQPNETAQAELALAS